MTGKRCKLWTSLALGVLLSTFICQRTEAAKIQRTEAAGISCAAAQYVATRQVNEAYEEQADRIQEYKKSLEAKGNDPDDTVDFDEHHSIAVGKIEREVRNCKNGLRKPDAVLNEGSYFVRELSTLLLTAEQRTCFGAKESAIKSLNDAVKIVTEKMGDAIRLEEEQGSSAHDEPSQARLAAMKDSLVKVVQWHPLAVKQIEDAKEECNNRQKQPKDIDALSDTLLRLGISSAVSPELRTAIERLSLHLLDRPPSLPPKSQPDECHQFPFLCDPISPLDAALNKLVAGNIAFNNPEHMKVGRTNPVEVKLSTRLSPSELKAQLTRAGKKESENLKVGDRMAATLNGGPAFEILPSGPEVQLIDKNEVTTWTWHVTPKTPGTQYLMMTFDAVIEAEGKDESRSVRTLTHQIDVEVGWPETAGEWFAFGKKWFENAGWIWASGLVPVGMFAGGWWHRLRRRKRHQPLLNVPVA